MTGPQAHGRRQVIIVASDASLRTTAMRLFEHVGCAAEGVDNARALRARLRLGDVPDGVVVDGDDRHGGAEELFAWRKALHPEVRMLLMAADPAD